MTEEQKETLKFYTTNDYLLINGLLWKESKDTIDEFIHLINADGLGVMQEARELGFDVRWNCSKEEGNKIYKMYQKRFPVIENDDVKKEIIERARNDIKNMMDCLEPLETELVLYRNIKTRFISNIEEGNLFKNLGFSSCSLNPHVAENAEYGSSNCTLFEITVPVGTPAIRLDLMSDICNEEDEVILPPMEFLVTKIDRDNNKVYMTCNALLESEY